MQSLTTVIAALLLAAPAFGQSTAVGGAARIRADAAALRPLAESAPAREFLAAADELPEAEQRTLFQDPKSREWFSPDAAAALDDDRRAALQERPVNPDFYYNTKYGSPLAYVRAIDAAARDAGFAGFKGRRVLDFGYGTIGHLRLIALCGGGAVGVDIDTLLPALYSQPGDQGPFGGRGGGVRLVHGRWPAEDAARGAVGAGYDLFISKNTLKRGYIHPEREADPRTLVDLGVDDETYVRALFDLLNPGGIAVIYNLSPAPAPADQPYKPWADGRCPFPREVLEAAGFRVAAYDAEDSAAARGMARLLGWDAQGMDLEADLFALYTVVVRP